MKKTLLFIALIASASLFAQDPVVQNPGFDKLVYKEGSTSTCSCAFWRNNDLASQGETSTITGGAAIKFDALEADGVYQEIAVLANTDYKLSLFYNFKDDSDITASGIDGELEIRVLKGSGFEDSYTPTYYTDAVQSPTSGFGYSDITIVEDASKNLATQVVTKPADTDYHTVDVTFSSGDETSIAIFIRGIGRPTTAPVDKTDDYTWSTGDQEIRVDYLSLTNEGATASVNDIFSSKISIYPNPANEFVQISTDETITGMEVYNLIGKKVISSSKLINNKLDVSNLSKGVYVLKVMSNDLVGSRKIIIE
ncbi:T9SS type A sorting domain-containing protein [Polaribacter sp. Hel1_85]|uniref:T9SS type A sorting domain-containing protein n=1 Tax=Polaribacter sp. Hel1_85 TaxID=1250005 RepID=UPI00052C997A|nr:T9SS type A sorting domain-containing protein [Polaribacter sp. Hel1_85]KGL61793.1 hypothetical protein PHEL85_1576 [Polaribacter sp. Hel1_85]